MQWLAEICIRRPVFAMMLIAALVVAGAAAYLQLGVDRFPKMDLPTVYVNTVYRGAAPEEMESEITELLEDSVATVEGIDELRSVSGQGTSILILTFNIDRDIDVATQDVRDAVNSILNRLPPGTDPPVVRKQDLDASPILSMALSGPRDTRELYLLADKSIKNVIESAPGVGQVTIAGATERAVKIDVEARRLAAYGLSISQVRQALERQNVEVPGGRVDAGIRELSLRTLGRFDNTRDFRDLVVATVQGTPVRLRDLAEVVDGTKEVRSLARLNGKPAIVLYVQRQSGANTVEVIDAVKKRMARCRELLPADVSLEIVQDQSRYINAAIGEVQKHLFFGSILASVVVLLFMRSWRSTLIAAIAIPASIIATFAMMRFMQFTLNNVTMLALVLMVGVVIDDAIVVLENVFHWIEEKGVSPWEAAAGATKEIGLAVLATTLSLVIVFLPVSFLSSVTGRMLFQFGLTATVAILVSMLVSFSLTPMMCSRLLRRVPQVGRAGDAGELAASRRGFYRWIDAGYTACLRLAMRHRWVVLLISLLTVAANYPLYQRVRKDYIPTNVDEAEFEVRVTAPEGVTPRAMAATMQQLENDVLAVAGVRKVLASVGSVGLGLANTGYMFVQLEPIDDRVLSLERLVRETLAGHPQAAFAGNFSQSQKMREVREKLKKYTDLRVQVRNLTALRQGAAVDIDFAVTGPDLEQLADFCDRLREKVNRLPGIVDADITLRLNSPELKVRIDRERAATLGVDVREIADTLRFAVGGDDRVSRYRDPVVDEVYDVELRLVGVDRSDPNSIAQLYVQAHPTGIALPHGAASAEKASTRTTSLTRVENVVRFAEGRIPARIDRLDRERMCAVRANITPGFALADRIEAVQQTAQELGMPSSFSTRVMGQGRELERTFRDFRWTFILSFIFMYIILAAQYEHLLHPVTILVSLPLAVPFGLVSLWLGGETLNLYSALGILVLFGVVKKASILQVDHTNQLRAAGMERLPAIMQANRDRLRPILMTTLAFVAGMLPLLIGVGPGSEERRSIAVLTVGGQTLSLLLTLLAVPVVYSYLDDLSNLFRRRKPSTVVHTGHAKLAGPKVPPEPPSPILGHGPTV